MRQSAVGNQASALGDHRSAGDSVTARLGPEQITEVLQAAGVLGCENRVERTVLAPLGADQSMMSSLYRVSLDYEQPCTAPSTVIAKVACEEPVRRSVADRFSFYEREIFFYERLADSVSFRVPECFYASLGSTAGGPMLILEDLGDVGVAQVEGCTWEQAVLVAGELARFHARWWGRVDSLDRDVHSFTSADYLENIQSIFTASWPGSP